MDVIPSGFPSIGAAYASFNEQEFNFIGFTYRRGMSHYVHDFDKNFEATENDTIFEKIVI